MALTQPQTQASLGTQPNTTLTQGQSYMGGIVNYDMNTGKQLAQGAQTSAIGGQLNSIQQPASGNSSIAGSSNNPGSYTSQGGAVINNGTITTPAPNSSGVNTSTNPTTDTSGGASTSNPYLAQVQSLSQLSPAEVTAQQQLNNLQSSYRAGTTENQGTLAPLSAISGDQSLIDQKYNNNAQTLQNQLALAQQQRQASLSAAQAGLDYTKPTSLAYGASLVNPATGATVNGGIFGGGSTGTTGSSTHSGINPATGLQPGANNTDILGYLSSNGVDPSRYDMPGLINAIQNGATAQDIISGRAGAAGAKAQATVQSQLKWNPASNSFQSFTPTIGNDQSSSSSVIGSNGIFSNTNEVKQFQAQHGLTVDGIVGPQTRAALQASGVQVPGSLGGSSTVTRALSSPTNTGTIPTDPYSNLTGNAYTLATTGVMPSGTGIITQNNLTKEVQKAIPGWSPVTAQASAAFWKSPDTQKFIANSNTVLNTINDPTNGIKALSDKVDRSNITIGNDGLLALKRATSDPDTAKFVQIANIAADEVSKLLGSGQGSDFAIHLGQTMVNPAYSKSTFNATMDNLASRVQNKVSEYIKQGGQGGSASGGATSTSTPKGSMSNSDFVSQAMTSSGINYNSFISSTPSGQIPVIDNKTGQPGHIPISEFNSSLYTKA